MPVDGEGICHDSAIYFLIGTNSDTSCTPCTASCPAGKYLSGECLATKNTICLDCPSGKFKEDVGGDCVACLSNCGPGFFLDSSVNTCTTATSPTCEACASNYFKPGHLHT